MADDMVVSTGKPHSPEIDRLRHRTAAHPGDVEAHFQLGECLLRSGQPAEAAESFALVLTVHPDLEPAHFNLGNALFAAGRFHDAASAYERAAELSPEAGTFNNLGNSLAAAGQPDRAIAAFRRAIELNPQFTRAYTNLGRIYATVGHHAEAIESLLRAGQLEPSNWRTHMNLAVVRLAAGLFEEAAASSEIALSLAPAEPDVHLCHGNIQHARNRLGEAMASLIRALELKPDDPVIYNSLGQVNQARGRGSEGWFCYLRALQIDPNRADVHSNWLLAMQSDENATAEQLFQEARVWANRHAGRQQPIPTPPAVEHTRRRLRIGYVSPNFRRHAIGQFLEPVLRNHDRSRVEITCYANQVIADELTAELRSHADRWRAVAHLTDHALAELIRADEIDILVDLTGHAPNHRLQTFARKPAAVQVTWLGSSGTTGLEQMDYLLCDVHTIPSGHDSTFTERPYRLADCFLCFAPPPDVELLPRSQDDCITFGSLNDLAHVTASVVRLWAQVLRAVPRSRLYLNHPALVDSSVQGDLLRLFAESEVDACRVSFAHSEDRTARLAAYRDVDIALDTFPCGGGMACLESLWMGVPVITLRGDRFAGRVTDSFLNAMGLDRFIADSRSEYVARAVELSDNRTQLADLRGTLRCTMQASPLCDTRQFTAKLEAAYAGMWAAAVRSQTSWCFRFDSDKWR